MINQIIIEILKKEFSTTLENLIKKHVPEIIKNGSKIILKNKNFEIVGVRNSRDKKIFIDLIGDFNCTNTSVNYSHTILYSGKY